MEYCQLIGGELDGVIFSHLAPQRLFPSSDFGRPGHPEDVETPSPTAKYRRKDTIASLHSSRQAWNVYLCQASAEPSPNELMRRVLPQLLGILPVKTSADWKELIVLQPGEQINPVAFRTEDGASVFWHVIVDDMYVNRGLIRRTVRSLGNICSDQLIVVYDMDGRPIKSLVFSK